MVPFLGKILTDLLVLHVTSESLLEVSVLGRLQAEEGDWGQRHSSMKHWCLPSEEAGPSVGAGTLLTAETPHAVSCWLSRLGS